MQTITALERLTEDQFLAHAESIRRRSYGAQMEEGAGLGPVPIAWWRFLGLSTMMLALYFGLRAVSTPHQTHPALLVPAVLLGGAAGLLVGRREIAVLSSPGRRGAVALMVGGAGHAWVMARHYERAGARPVAT